MNQIATRSRLMTAVVLSLLGIGVAGAEDVSADALVQALTPPALTRSLSSTARPVTTAPKDDEAFLDTLRNKPSRAFDAADRSKLLTLTADKPNVDLTMDFPYASSVLRPGATAVADKLGKALSDPALRDKTFVLAGHTDAKGSDTTNLRLSERRAEAVKKYLVRHYNIKPANLIAVGYGKTDLKDPNDPFAQRNRRVQTINVLPYQSAAK